ncbi:MAG: [FeFe] hydrogenase H-cluster radical SAM maturase HydG [Candidatus Gastranaerophilaceae bacterium]
MKKFDYKAEIIRPDIINELIENNTNKSSIDDILNKALKLKGLDLDESARLLNIDNEEDAEKMFHAAKKLKEIIYGNRIVLFAPLYAANVCTNNCLYCGFRHDNQEITRCVLTPDEVAEEAKAIMNLGHKRIVLLTGEDYKETGLDYLEECIDKIYKAKVFNGEIRRVNVNIAPLSVEDFKRLDSFGIGTYQLFQETYNEEVYKYVHPSGKKSNYRWRLEAMDRALEAGMHDVGIGPLFGLTDYRFETLATLMHSHHLDAKFGIGPHTISVPRIEPAKGVTFSENPPEKIDEFTFKKIVAVLRLSVPYTGIILSTRETPSLRKALCDLGASQISAESRVNPGGYSVHKESDSQFTMSDNRSLDEIVKALINDGYTPSFCTACYRKGRIGKDFMDLAKPGLIKKFCQPNAISTLAEYLYDYASDETKTNGLKFIEKQIAETENPALQSQLTDMIAKVAAGERDVYN